MARQSRLGRCCRKDSGRAGMGRCHRQRWNPFPPGCATYLYRMLTGRSSRLFPLDSPDRGSAADCPGSEGTVVFRNESGSSDHRAPSIGPVSVDRALAPAIVARRQVPNIEWMVGADSDTRDPIHSRTRKFPPRNGLPGASQWLGPEFLLRRGGRSMPKNCPDTDLTLLRESFPIND